MLTDNWQLVSNLNWNGSTKKTLPVALSASLNSRIIKTKTRASGIPARWYRAGYLRVMSSVNSGFEIASFKVPVNATKIFPVAQVTPIYQLIFTPVDYLPNLNLQVWAYKGDAEAILQELSILN